MWDRIFTEPSVFQQTYEMIPGFIACILGVVGVSLLDKNPAADVVSRFEQADKLYRDAN